MSQLPGRRDSYVFGHDDDRRSPTLSHVCGHVFQLENEPNDTVLLM
jgi:hypothetical protein